MRVVDLLVCCNAIVYGSRDSIYMHHVFYNTVVRCVCTVVGAVREFRQFSHLYVLYDILFMSTDRKTMCVSTVRSFSVCR